MKPIIALLTAFVIGCGSFPNCFSPPAKAAPNDFLFDNCPKEAVGRVRSAELVPYIKLFIADAQSFGVGCYYIDRIILAEVADDKIAGYCHYNNKIIIDSTFWKHATEAERLVLVYHELGHCALGLDHTAETETEIMNPYVLHGSVVRRYWDELRYRMFEQAKKQQADK